MPVLTGLATACPEHLCRQEDVRSFAAGLFGGRAGNRIDRLAQLFDNAGIHTRHFASPLEWYGLEHDFTQKNARYVDAATELAERVVRRCLDNAATAARDIDHIVFATSTGVSTPSLEARIAGRLGFSQRIRRTPIWGLGCAGGAGGLARAADFARAEPESRVLFVSLELCSLTFQKNDLSKSNLVAAALFGDGAAAILVLGDAVAARSAAPGGPRLRSRHSGSTLWPESLDVMGWELNPAGLKVMFSRDIPKIVRGWLKPRLDEFLAPHGLTPSTIEHLGFHPGGPRVLDAYRHALGVSEDSLRPAREVLRDFGNMSSPTCLFVLERLLRDGIRCGERVLLLALGPGFSAEYILLEGMND